MTQYAYQYRPRYDNSVIPTVIFFLLIANGLMFAAQQFTFHPVAALDPLVANLALWPLGSGFAPWQLVTYGFLHGSVTHIFFNMFGLWMFGRDLERLMGPRRFVTFYLTCVIGAGLVQLVVAATASGGHVTLGASGGIFGILLAYAMHFPDRTVILLFPPIPMRAKVFVLLYGLLELYLGVSGRTPGVANFAHLGGMLFGFILLQYWRSQQRR